MGLRFDKFTWVVIGIVVLLLLAAVISVNVGGGGEEQTVYLEEDTPAAPVFNAFLALQEGNLSKARAQYSQRVLDEIDSERGYGPFSDNYYDPRDTARRLRIVEVEIAADDPDRALVTFVQDRYENRGLFGSGSTYSNQRRVEVVREDGVWKLDTAEFFY